MNKIFEYQSLDSTYRKIEADINASEERKKIRYFSQYLKDAEDSLKKMDRRAEELNNLVAKATLLFNAQEETLKEYSQLVKKTKDVEELNYLAKKTADLARSIQAIERDLRNYVRDIDDINRQYEDYSHSVPQAQRQLKEYRGKFDALVEGRKEEVNQIKLQMQKLEKEINNKPLLEKYYKLKAQGIFPPFVELTDEGRCGGCQMEIASGQRSQLDIRGSMECENCHRIILTNR